ncbi:MAG: AAA family ATPase [Gammaproteobacteria bacterium]|nr:AAA family ATPase [Gammaproteobacteria bacterium]
MQDSNKALALTITKGMSARYPLIYIVGREEERIEGLLSLIASRPPHQAPLITWSLYRGFSDSGESQDPLEALARIRQSEQSGFFLMKDLPACFPDNPVLLRALRDLYYELKHRAVTVFISYPNLVVPDILSKEIYLVEMGLPSRPEIRNYLENHWDKMARDPWAGGDFIDRLSMTMSGLTLNEMGHLLFRLSRLPGLNQQTALREVYDYKSQALHKESCLGYIPPEYSLDEIGGLNNLKKWVLKRKQLFTEKAIASGVPLPSGILLMGVSGCGKSMAAKTIAAAWNLPLVKLDMSLVLSGSFGAPESAFHHAIQVAEQIAPVVLWIDELENSFGFDEAAPGSGNVNIFSSFLSWMQDKPSNVFLAATANRIQLLPAELIRKGRFDQLFFLDLPGKKERIEIFKIHIPRQGGDPDQFELGYLAALTKDWSGAEIEQAVISARVDAYQEDRGFTEQDIARNTSQTVPLARTMKEQLKAIKDWSQDRAVSAS